MRTITALHALLFATLVLMISALALRQAGRFEAPKADPAVLEGGLTKAFETQYDAAFPARTFGVNLWAAIDYALFHEGRRGIVVGRSGWLYTDEEFRLDNQSRRNERDNLALIVRVRDTLARQGIPLLLAVVPAKARIYPEFLADRKPPELHAMAYETITAALRRDAIPSANLLGPLRDGKADAPTYLRTDTHWTPFGARIAATAVGAAVQKLGLPPVTPTHYRGVIDGRSAQRGDLFNFLPLDPYFAWLLPPPDQLERTHTEIAGGASNAGLLDDAPAPRIALVGTSYSANPHWDFAGALEQVLQEPIANYAKDGIGPFAPMAIYLHGDDFRQAPPKLVIWEFPERYVTTPQRLEATPPPDPTGH